MPTRTTRTTGGSALLAVIQLACASTPPPAYDLFAVPPETFFETTRSIALFSLSADEEVPACLDSIGEQLLITGLEAAGFTVIPSFVQQEIWLRITEDAGGFYDPLTGELDQGRFDAAVQLFRSELMAKEAPDAILYPHLWAIEAAATGGTAWWDGVSQSVSYRLGDVALTRSYGIVIEDPRGVPLFVNGGGLHVAERWDSAARAIVGVPAEELCAEPRRIVEAVEIALEPLVHRGTEQR